MLKPPFTVKRPKTRRLSLLAFLFTHILHCSCFKILFTEWKYLATNWNHTCLIRTIKKCEINRLNSSWFLVSLYDHNHCFIILKLFRAIKFFILNQIKLMASGFNFTTYGKFMDTSSIEELQIRKPLSPIWAFSSITRKRQAMSFEPLRFI